MKNALISPLETPIYEITSWTDTVPYEPIKTAIPDSCRIAETSDVTFEVSLPLFWIICEDNVIADEFYYDTKDGKIYPIINVPPPE
jgi:hypothetical protein